ncbi:hypothetical protein SAMD00019534_011230 [Acytostelium subglobosum LB1]|uniref:hypothetical protein n=1 Tax=Acytostelium subglobosum LB1 TaxID=1410327 RepID=UPI000644D8DD|nr:hypothetical protein SAMD00019534_011230 [Acytostelium subglobosum LB1]GAM17948.1 hypothetical protein SAMD00019534_011230 [Acytostelium subglobosum LB1]|eukprot:XP_012758544.1 hypothetical protein SAMD00019534_011230 [Acytostelium subglobosum LB1]
MFTAVSVPKIPGDYSISNTFQLSRMLKQDNNKVVADLAAMLRKDVAESKAQGRLHMLSERVETEKGFVNITLSHQYLEACLRLWCSDDSATTKQPFALEDIPTVVKDVLVDFASPNMSKELHVGHLRSIALGESVCRILEYRGHNVERISHAGDFGTPMGMVILHALEQRAPFLQHIWDKQCPHKTMQSLPTPKELSALYTGAKNRTKKDAEFLKQTQLTAAELQKGPPTPEGGGSNPDIYQAWLDICEASRAGFNEIYKLLNVKVNERGESYYREWLEDVIGELDKKGLVTISDGAHCIFLPGQKVPVIIKKSDGAYLYATTDLAAIKRRLLVDPKQWIIVITDDSQKGHFQQVFEIARMAGWLTDQQQQQQRVDHLAFGLVRGENGHKLSSRDGDTLALSELLDEAVERAKQATITSRSLTRAEKLDTGHTAQQVEGGERVEDRFEQEQSNSLDHYRRIGLGAIKYFDLSQRTNTYVFSFDKMLSFKGNTSIYVLYCYTRISTLMKRCQFDITTVDINSVEFGEFTEKERKIVLMISKFPDTIRTLESTLKPGVLCDYLWDISDCFHHFYESDRIIGSDRMVQRLLICHAIQRVIKTGFQLLGIDTVDRL